MTSPDFLDSIGLSRSAFDNVARSLAQDRYVVTPAVKISSPTLESLDTFASDVVDPLKTMIAGELSGSLIQLIRRLCPDEEFKEPEFTLVVPRPGGEPASSSGDGNFAFLEQRSRMLFGLLCIHAAAAGGANGWVSAKDIFEALSVKGRAKLETMKVAFHPPAYAKQAAYEYGRDSADPGHILSYDRSGNPVLRWNRQCVGADVLSEPAVEELLGIIESQKKIASLIQLKKYAMLIGHNRYGLHWREPFVGQRLFLRIYFPYH
jgi:hypothetical protein